MTTSSPVPPATTDTTARHREDPALDRLLDAELDFSPIARSNFISHLAMGLVAARRLGASDSDLSEWYDQQTAGDFLIPRDRPDWLDAETRRVDQRGIETVIADELPALTRAPASQFFHAIIRLDLAVDARHAGQVANALHNWNDDAHPLAGMPDGTGGDDFASVIERLGRIGPLDSRHGFHDVAADAAFQGVVGQLAGDDDLLDQVAAVAAASHTEPRDFGTLHLITGTRAARALAVHLDAAARQTLALRTAHAVAVAYVAFGAPELPGRDELDRRRAGAPSDWGRIDRAAIDSGDPHVAKLVYACHLEFELTGDPIHVALAARQASVD